MKNVLLPAALAAIIFCGWRLLEGRTVTYSVPLSYVAKAETSAVDPIILTRTHRDDSVRLEVPRGGTETDASLYAGPALPPTGSAPLASIRIFGGSSTSGGAKPVLDLTGLKDGNYLVHYTSCAAGAVIHVVLATKEESGHPIR